MKINRAVQITYFLLRVIAGLLFIQFGGLILFGWFGGIPEQLGTPPLVSQTGIGGLLEFFAGSRSCLASERGPSHLSFLA